MIVVLGHASLIDIRLLRGASGRCVRTPFGGRANAPIIVMAQTIWGLAGSWASGGAKIAEFSVGHRYGHVWRPSTLKMQRPVVHTLGGIQAFSGRKGDLAARSKRGLRGVALSESALAVL
jgi:hypothetical protein